MFSDPALSQEVKAAISDLYDAKNRRQMVTLMLQDTKGTQKLAAAQAPALVKLVQQYKAALRALATDPSEAATQKVMKLAEKLHANNDECSTEEAYSLMAH